MTQAPAIKVNLLGPFSVTVAEETPSLRRKTRALLAYLAATRTAHTRTALMGIFCREAKSPARVLTLLLSRIRKHLSPDVLLTERDSVAVNADRVWVDWHAFSTTLGGNLENRSVDALSTAVSHYRGEFLDGLTLDDAPEFELWLLGRRAQARQLLQRGLMALIAHYSDTQQYETAVRTAHRLLQQNPLLEDAHARLIWLYAQMGQRDAALRQYEQCRRLLQEELAVEPTPELQALHADVAAGRVRRATTVTPRAPQPAAAGTAADFVGRAGELDQLQQAWQQAAAGNGQVMVLAAEAGSGKTRLVQEFGRTRPLLTGRCYESTRVLPYQPWIELLEQRLRHFDDEQLQQLPAATTTELVRLLPALARRLPGKTAVSPPDAGELEHLFAAVFDFLSHAPDGSPQPTLLFLDDLQWADEVSLHLFHYVARRAAHTPLLLLGALRSEETDPPLQTLLADLRRLQVTRLSLSPFSRDEIARLIEQTWSALPPGYRSHVVDMLTAATGGNALFVTAVLDELTRQETLPETLPVPDTVQELIQRRLQRLPSSGRQVIEAIAIHARPTSFTDAQTISSRSEEETAVAIDHGLQSQLLQTVTADGGARYDFHHELVRDAVLAQVNAIRRELLHRRTARRLAETGAPAAVLAHHWQMAHDPVQEAHFAAEAGRQAAAVYAHDEAVRYFRRALDLLPDGDEAMDVRLRLGQVWHTIGEWEPAAEIYEQALALAQTAVQRADCAAALGQLRLSQGDFTAAINHLAQALNLYGAGDESDVVTGRVRVLDDLATVHNKQGQYEEALSCARQAVALAEEHGLAVAPRCYSTLGLTLAFQNDFAAAVEALETGLQQAQARGDEKSAARCHSNMSLVHWQRGDFDRALTHAEEALAIMSRLSHKQAVAQITNNIGLIYTRQGKIDAALDHFRQSLAIEEELGSQDGIARGVGNIAFAHMSGGDYEQARPFAERALALEEALENQEGVVRNLFNLAVIHFETGAYAQALDYHQQALALEAKLGEHAYIANTLGNVALVYGRSGRLAMSLRCLRAAAQIEVRLSLKEQLARTLGNMGRMVHLQGDVDTAARLAAQAVQLERHVGMPREMCRDLETQATLALAQNRLRRALALARESERVAREQARAEVALAAQLLVLRAQVGLGDLSRQEARAALADLRAQHVDAAAQADILYALWQLNADDREAVARETAVFYRDLHADTPDIRYRRRYQALTGDVLPAPDPLPDIDIPLDEPPPLDVLLDRVDALLAELG